MRALKSLLFLFIAGAIGCASPPPEPPPLSVSAIRPGSGETIAVDQALVLIDTSASVEGQTRRVARSFISGMPSGGYEAGVVNFGGFEREVHDLARFDRRALDRYAEGMTRLNEGTPIHLALAEAGEALDGKRGRAAIVLISDGLPTDEIGRDVDPALALDAARALRERHRGEVCMHTVQIGTDPAGTNFLKSLSQAVGCGTFRSDSSLASETAYQRFGRDVFVAAAQTPPAVAAGTANDSDGDGVPNNLDRCPDTIAGARVDFRGCWAMPGANFATDSAKLNSEGRSRLSREVVPLLQQNPSARILIEGHTDDRGSASHNQALSERRAEAVREFLVGEGIGTDRLEAVGRGKNQPAVPNDSAENMRINRRVELTVAP